MSYNKDKVDELTLSLLYLVMTKDEHGIRAWKGVDWETMNQLSGKGYIGNPKNNAKSVTLSKAGARRVEELFRKRFSE